MSRFFCFAYGYKFFSIILLLVLSGCAHNRPYDGNDINASAPASRPADSNLAAELKIKAGFDEQNFALYQKRIEKELLANYNGFYRHRNLESRLANILQKLSQAAQLALFEPALTSSLIDSSYSKITKDLTAADLPNSAMSTAPRAHFRLFLLNSPKVNAFALADGKIYLTRGLLALVNDEAEMAAILAHEMAHIMANHALLRLQKQKEISQNLNDKLATLPFALHLGAPKDALQQAKLSLAQFSRQQESQADQIAITILYQAGYDVHGLARFLQQMENYASFRHLKQTGYDSNFLANHPATPQRIKAAQSQANELTMRRPGARFAKRFLYSMEGLLYQAISKASFKQRRSEQTRSNAASFIRGNNFINKKERFLLTLPENFTLSMKGKVLFATDQFITPNNEPQDKRPYVPTALYFDQYVISAKQTDKREGAMANDPLDYLRNSWLSSLQLTFSQSLKINNLASAYGEAFFKGWYFALLVIKGEKAFYRFIISSKNQQIARDLALEAAQNLRFLKASEVKAIKPLYIAIKKLNFAKKHSNLPPLARLIESMQQSLNRDSPVKLSPSYVKALFCLLNGLDCRNLDKIPLRSPLKILISAP